MQTKHIPIPMAEILQQTIYVSANEEGELQIRYASQGSDLREGDYMALADNTRILNGGLDTFLSSGEKEVIVPVIDDTDRKYSGVRFLGFVQLQNYIPRKVTIRRGEAETLWDMDEGGPAPTMQVGNVVISGSGALLADDKAYVPPPAGGGLCITGRDCFWHNGTCVGGHCQCNSSATGMTGSYCQLYRPDKSKVSEMLAFRQQRKLELEKQRVLKNMPTSGQQALNMHATRNMQAAIDAQVKVGSTPRPPPIPVPETSIEHKDSPTMPDQSQSRMHSDHVPVIPEAEIEAPSDELRLDSKPVKKKVKVKAKMKPKPKAQTDASQADNDTENDAASVSEMVVEAKISTGGNEANQGVSTTNVHASSPKTPPIPSAPVAAPDDEEPIDETDARQRFLRDKRRREKEAQKIRDEEAALKAAEDARIAGENRRMEADREAFQREVEQRSTTEKARRLPPDMELGVDGTRMAASATLAATATVEDLYGPGKAYPDPYMAGKVPSELVHARQKARAQKKEFIYAVRYRSGPLGLTFDNTITNGTVVERVGKGMQSDTSDVQAGDIVIAIDQYNISTAPAKVAQRIMASLNWPRIVCFKVRGELTSPEDIARENIRRSVDMSVVYPPMLQQELKARLADWSVAFDNEDYLRNYLGGTHNKGHLGQGFRKDMCQLYMLRAASDSFGCSVQPNEYLLPEKVLTILRRQGDLDQVLTNVDESLDKLSPQDKLELEKEFPMLLMLTREASIRGVQFALQPVAVAKRGICTFVQKAASFASNGAMLGLVVNTKEGDVDGAEMPRGKEDTGMCKVPIAMANFSDAELLQAHAADRPNAAPKLPEIYALRDTHRMTPSCKKLQSIIEDVVDAWPHSVPHIAVDDILYPENKINKQSPGNSLQNREAFKPRKTADEGGRIAISGENGWAFFDYHLANFGPSTEELPLATMKLVMAMPAFGCDPSAYTIRITGSVVAILRGGGCSFGIKVINAQKLGALAVLIVNTDDAKTMRLMALPDEIPQITIPCLMVSRRLQFFLEAHLKKYYALNQHLMSIHPTGVFGMYEERNTVPLPVRLDVGVPSGKK